MENSNMIEVSLMDLFRYIRKRLWILIAVAVVSALGTFLVCKLVIAPEYIASTRIYVLNRASDSSVVAYSDFQASNQLRKDYQELIVGKNVTSEVIQRLNLQMTDAYLANKISISSPEDTRILQINVKDVNPQLAALIANTVRDVARRQIVEIMDIDAVNVVYEASVPRTPSTPRSVRDTAIVTMLSVVVTMVLLVLLFLLDDRMKSEDDVQRYLGLSTIGVIPVTDALQKRNYHPEKRKSVMRGMKKK